MSPDDSVNSNSSDSQTLEKSLLEALDFHRQASDIWGEMEVLTDLGHIAIKNGDLPSAKDHFESCLVLSRSIGDWETVAGSQLNLASVYRRMANLEEAEAAANASLSISSEIPTSKGNQPLWYLGKYTGRERRIRPSRRDVQAIPRTEDRPPKCRQ